MSDMPTYRVIAERAGEIWFISVPDVPKALFSTRRHDQIDPLARGVIAQELGIPPASFEIVIRTPGS
jgi:hypothetical protein